MGRLRYPAEGRNDCADAPCLACGAPTKPRYTFDPYVVMTCRDCGFGRLDPIPSESVLDRLYASSAYFEGTDRAGYADYSEQVGVFERTFAAKLDLLLRFGPVSRLLEIGCGPGTFLEVARQRGVEGLVGVDRNPWAIERAQAAGFDARVGSIESIPAEHQFDAAVLLDVLEHVRDPGPFLVEVRRRLRPGGRLLIMTPNIASILARVSGRRWVSFKIPEHILYFTPRSIGFVLGDAGFRTRLVRGTGQYATVAFCMDRLSRIAPRLAGWATPALRGLGLLDRVVYIPNGSIDVVAETPDEIPVFDGSVIRQPLKGMQRPALLENV